MSILLALFIGIGLARLFMLPIVLGVILGLYIYNQTTHIPKNNYFNWEAQYRSKNAGLATYHHHLFSLMGYLAKADGVVTKKEIASAENIMAELGLNYSQKSLAKSSFKSGSSGLNLINTISFLTLLKHTKPQLLSSFFNYQERIIHADQNPRMNQINILNQIKFRLYQDPGQQTQRPLSNNDLSAAYRTLGIHAKMPYPDMKKSYQKLVGKNHPDRARTEQDRLKAEAYIKTIQNAWRVVKKQHKETA